MFKNAKLKLSTAISKVARRARAHAEFRRPTDSSSDGEPLPDPWKRILPKKRASSPRQGLRKKRRTGVENLARPGNASQLEPDSDGCKAPCAGVSNLNLDSDDRTVNCGAIHPPPESKNRGDDNPQSCVKTQSRSRQQEAHNPPIENADMRFITIHTLNQQHRALLLPSFVHQRTRALVYARQDLRAVNSELATAAAELDNLVLAQNELEEQDYREVPGAFLDDDAYVDRERRLLLVNTVKKKIRFCELTLKDAEAHRPWLEANFEVLQEQLCGDVERAVRDDLVACASRSRAGGTGRADAWTTL